ncbi:MAG: dihydroorotate dehydrogenase, partial [Methanomicrobia archaeon]|nr:dihydroorotate dehydrogenase [Methanomicrobia archaeon]
MADLSVEFAGINFKNPIVLASATPTMNAKMMKKGIEGGAAGVVAKSLFGESGKMGRKYPRPRFKLFDYRGYPGYPDRLPHSFTLHSLEECSSFDYEDYAKDINETKRLIGDDGVVIASLSGATDEEWEKMCEVINGTDADLVELNISCPFAAEMGIKMGAGAVDLAPGIVKLCKKNLALPFSVKLSPQTLDPVVLAKEVEKAGAYGVTLSARLSGIMIDIETAAPIGWGSIGGYGGPYLIGYGLKWVSKAYGVLNIPISAVLGVWDWEDIIRYQMVGATTTQSAAAIMLRGYNISKKWIDEIKNKHTFKPFKNPYHLKDLVKTR